MNNLYTFVNNKMIPIDDCIKDDYMQELLDTEFGEKESLVSDETNDLIKRYGFSWDPLSIPGYLTFRPYAAFMEEATKLHIWKLVQGFCLKNKIPLHRIAGGDLYSLDNSLMKKHVELAEKVGMYGDGLLKVTGNHILRFSGCSNKLSLLKQVNFDDKTLPFGIFEISDSYRYEQEERLNLLVRNRLFHLPELHIVNENLEQGLKMLLKGHEQMKEDMKENNMEYIMLFSTTKKFITENEKFIERICKECKHNPVINVAEDDTCENGIVFDVEYKARMGNGTLVEIGTFQIDEGTTDFAYNIKYKNKPVTTVHAVFFASSIERTIFTYCDKSANSDELMPNWLVPVHCRIIPLDIECSESAIELGNKLVKKFRVEVDDRNMEINEKIKDAILLKVPYIIRIGNSNIEIFDRKSNDFYNIKIEDIFSKDVGELNILNQYSPILLSQKVIK